ncbi:MAG TPA: ADOP family duplicated permease [Thermoanaerobaculia bacterium]|nr:ADOP family duplicated permease [Thermoanaerobaculia bacterium]
MASILRELAFAVHGLRRSKLFAIVSIATVALAAGVAGSVFGVTDTLLLRSLPYPEAERLVAVRTGLQDRDDFPASPAEYLDYRNESTLAEAVGAWAVDTTTARIGNGDPEVVLFAWLTPSVQPILGLTTTPGRPFLEEEAREGAPAVVVLSHSYWSSRFGEDPAVVDGRDLHIGGVPHRIIGVAARDFAPPGASPAIYRPLQLPETSEQLGTRSSHFLNVVARLGDGVSFEQAIEESSRLVSRWESRYRGDHVLTAELHPMKLRRLSEWALGEAWRSIRMILWGAALVVLLACANLSSLMLARGETRKIELGVRSALGAGFGRLARMVLVESVAVALAGGIAGIGLSAAVLRWVGRGEVGAMRVGASSLGAASLDWRLALFTILVAAACGVAFGILPSMAARRIDLARLLSGSGRSRGSSRGMRRLFHVLVFVQLALAAVLLNGTALLIDGFRKATGIPSGFDPESRIAFRVRMSETEYPNGEPVLSFYDRAREAIAEIPGVESVAATRALPMRNQLGTEAFIHEGETYSHDTAPPQVDFQTVSPGYYGTMGIAILAGRPFDERDRPGFPKVAMLNRSAALAYFGGVREALGRRIVPLFMGGPDADPFTIVGVSEDVRHLGPIGEVRPELALPIAQAEGWVFGILRRGEFVVCVRPGMEESVMSAIRTKLGALAPGVPIDEAGSMTAAVAESVAYERFLAELTTGFGVLALAIAAVGVLGVVWFGVNTRWREFGVRMALGQTAPSIVGLVLAQGLKLGIAGAAVGAAATIAVHRVVESVVPLAGAFEPSLVALSTGVLLASVVIACLVPALRAGRLDPATVLGAE